MLQCKRCEAFCILSVQFLDWKKGKVLKMCVSSKNCKHIWTRWSRSSELSRQMFWSKVDPNAPGWWMSKSRTDTLCIGESLHMQEPLTNLNYKLTFVTKPLNGTVENLCFKWKNLSSWWTPYPYFQTLSDSILPILFHNIREKKELEKTVTVCHTFNYWESDTYILEQASRGKH